MDAGAWIALAAFAMTGVGFVVRHAKTHQKIEDRLQHGDGGFTAIRSDLSEVTKRQARSEIALRELLVAHGLRKPGQGINGEKVE